MKPRVSIIIRTYNESKYLGKALEAVRSQNYSAGLEVLIVDSGSTDNTREIAQSFDCEIIKIAKDEFSFGRSLNRGCSNAKGDFLVFISGHCIPADNDWLKNLIQPFADDQIALVYGRQTGGSSTKFSEQQLFLKYFPKTSKIPQMGFFCNNANAAIRKSVWMELPYDEDLTGLEDMDWAKQAIARGHKIAYEADSCVIHLHEETWKKVKLRYEREAIALQRIMPEIHLSVPDFLRYFFSGVLNDWSRAIKQRKFLPLAIQCVLFRFCQYYGSYAGNHEHRRLSKAAKERYFYPR